MTTLRKPSSQRVQTSSVDLLVITVIAAGVRLVAASFAGIDDPPQYDGQGYDLLAHNLFLGAGYTFDGSPTAFRVPLYPVFLMAVYTAFGHSYAAVRILQALIGGITAALGYVLARNVRGRKVALFAGLGLAIHPFLIYTATLFYSENIFIPLFIALNISLSGIAKSGRPTRAALIAAGATFGFASLTRPNMYVFLPVVFLWALLLFNWYRGIGYAAAIVGISLCLMVPWAIRNSLVFGSPVGITTGSGVVLWQGNNPLADGGGVMPSVETWEGEEPPDKGFGGWSYLPEQASDQRFRSKALDWITNNPVRFTELLFVKVYRLWAPNRLGMREDLPIPSLVLIGYFGAVCTAFVTPLLDHKFWRPELSFYLFTVCFILVAGVTFGASRHSLPLAPFVLIWLGAAFWRFWGGLLEHGGRFIVRGKV